MLKRVQHDEMIISMRRGNVGTSARNVPTPSPLTTLLRRICYSLFLSIRVCDPTTENMFFCSSVKRSHYSLLKSHCRFPSLQTADVCGTSEYHGFKNPRLFALTGIASFRRHYLYIITEKRKRLEDVNMNSRGLLNPRFPHVRTILASVKTRIGVPLKNERSFLRKVKALL